MSYRSPYGLAPEIWTAIIRDDALKIPDLEAFSMTCRFINGIVRPIVWEGLKFNFGDELDEKIILTLAGTLELQGFVRELCIAGFRNQLEENGTMIEALKGMKNLRRLDLKNTDVTRSIFKLMDYSRIETLAVEGCCRFSKTEEHGDPSLPSLKDLQVADIEIPDSRLEEDMFGWIQLLRLPICEVQISADSSILALEHFTITGDKFIPSVQKLSLSLDDSTLDDVRRILENCRTVRTLEFFNQDPLYSDPDHECHGGLENLHLELEEFVGPHSLAKWVGGRPPRRLQTAFIQDLTAASAILSNVTHLKIGLYEWQDSFWTTLAMISPKLISLNVVSDTFVNSDFKVSAWVATFMMLIALQ